MPDLPNFAAAYKLELVTCALMTGLIWLIQIVHYPGFAFVDSSKFINFHEFHSRRITWIVLPVMTTELLVGLWMVWSFKFSSASLLNAFGLLVIWTATAYIGGILHGRLAAGMDLQTIEQMVQWNWVRTIAWSFRLLLLMFFFE